MFFAKAAGNHKRKELRILMSQIHELSRSPVKGRDHSWSNDAVWESGLLRNGYLCLAVMATSH